MTDKNETDRTAAHGTVDRQSGRQATGGGFADEADEGGPVVRFKRRRRLGMPEKPGAQPLVREEKATRTFRVPASTGGPVGGTDLASAAAMPANPPPRRARRDPARRPGAVTRIVFESPAPEAPRPDDELGIGLHAPSPFDEVRQALVKLRRLLDEARRARAFRIL